MSVDNFGIMSIVIYSTSVAYTSLYRGLKYLLKIPYFIHNYPNMAGFLIFETLFWASRKHCPISEKISQKWAGFVFGRTHFHQTFTKCVSNQYTQFDVSTCQMELKVMESPLNLSRYLGIFIHFWRVFMSKVLYLHQTLTHWMSD